MPCTDQTELLELRLDDEEWISAFSLTKRTCNQTVGGTQLLPYVHGKTIDQVRRLSPEHLPQAPSGVAQFLLLKQLFCLHYALEILTGDTEGGPDDAVALQSIAYDQDGTVLSAQVAVNLIAAEITACGGCRCSIPVPSGR